MELLLRRGAPGAPVVRYDPDLPLPEISTSLALIATDPRLVVSSELFRSLLAALERTGAEAAVPLSSAPGNEAQAAQGVVSYATLREYETAATEIRQRGDEPVTVEWHSGDPAILLIPTDHLEAGTAPTALLNGRSVAVARDTYIHKFVSHRGQPREDILQRVPADAREVLEFGCGEGVLGAALRERHGCRVTGIELDPAAAAIARERLDVVIEGDIRDLVHELDAHFDAVIGGDVVEHLDDPWSVLEALRAVTRPGGRLILSLPNIAAASVISDLLRGRFDYVYLGILCAGHLRFFTRSSISDLLESTGWELESLEPQETIITPDNQRLVTQMDAAGVEYEKVDLDAPGWYVIARNPAVPS